MAITGSPIEQRSGQDPDEQVGGAARQPAQHDKAGDPGDQLGASGELALNEGAQAAVMAGAGGTPSPADRGAGHPLDRHPGKRPVAFLAELARAMHAAAEAERAAVLERSRVDAHAFAEQVQVQSADEAAALKRGADEDVAAIREWSKAEIARIREETEQRIGGRRRELDFQLEQHAAAIERRLDRVRAQVDAFEAEMGEFFERLLQEQDPARFAEMAASLPEPPSFEGLDEADIEEAAAPEPEADADTAVADAEPAGEIETAPDADAESTASGEPEPVAEATAETGGADGESEQPADEMTAVPIAVDDDRGSTFAAAEAAAAADAAQDDGSTGADDAISEDESASWATRLASLVGYPNRAPESESQPQLAAAAAAQASAPSSASATSTTQVVVVGLVSVASIAGFKRQLAHLPGVAGVGVSSGPDGEFVFRVTHDESLVVRDAIPTLPGFQARIVSSGSGIVHVAARDPEGEG